MAKKKPPAKKEIVESAMGITGHQKAEEALRQREGQFRLIVNNSRDIIFTMNIKGEFIFVSPVVKDVLGYNPPELQGRPFQSIIHPDDIPACEEAIRKNIEKGDQTPGFECRVKDRSGNWHWHNTSGAAVLDANGSFLHFLGIAKDVTERKKTESALQQSQEKYAALIENINDVLYTLDTQGNITFVSPVVERFTKYKVSDLIGKHFIPLIYPDDLPGLLESFERLASGQLEPWEFRALDKDGRIIFMHSSSRPIYEGGQVVGFATLMTDITGRKQLEESLLRSEERYRTMLEQMYDSCYEVDLAGNFTFVNDSVCHNLGYSSEEMVGQSYRFTTPPDDIKPLSLTFNEVFRTGVPNTGFAHGILRKDGSIILVESSISLRKNELGEIIGFQSVSRDITERKKAEKALQESAEQLRASLENAPDGVFMNDFEGNVLYGNRRCEEIIGYKREELTGKNFRELNILPENSLARAAEILQDNISDKFMGPDELELIRKDGRRVPVEINASVVQRGGEKVVLTFVRDISQRKKTEAALRESEARYRLLSEHTTDSVWLMDMNLKITYVSPSAEKMRGLPLQEMMEMPLEQHITPESLKFAYAVFLEELPRVEADPDYNAVRTLELEYYYKDGATAWAECKFSVIRDPSGKPVSFLGEARNITERKRAEDALRESEERSRESAGQWQATFDSINDLISIQDTDFRLVRVNKVYADVMKTKPEDLIGKHCYEVVHGTSCPVDNCPHEQTIKTKKAVTEELFEPRLGVFLEVSTSPIFNVAGEMTGTVHLVKDITGRKQAQEELRDSEEKYRMVVENALEGIIILMDGMLKFANRRTMEISGYSQEELLSRPFIQFIHPDDRQRVTERYLQRLSGMDVPNPHAFRGVHKSGEIKWVEFSSMLITWEGRPATLNFMTDITDRKRLEEEQQRVEKLESVGLLAGGIAHDFNNILTAILGNISLARMEAAPGSEMHESLEQAEKASLRAKDLTQQLLTFARGGAPVKKLASLKELLRDTAGFALRGSNVKCHFSIPADLWHAEIDKGQVSQVIHNLVINAQQAMPTGGAIELRAENMTLSETQSLGRGLPLKKGKYIRIAVTDHGSGIAAEHLAKIFDPFFSTKQKGSGLGLATSFSIAHQHGGHISVESEPGSGSTFYLYLPASMQTSTPKQVKKEQVKAAGKARILVMDDEKGIREVAGRMLKHIGYKDVVFAADGAAAVKLYKAAMESGQPFSVVILDLTIAGGMGGIVTMRELLKVDPAVKAIVSSGYADESVMSGYREYGFSGMVAKPYTIGELGKAVHDVIG